MINHDTPRCPQCGSSWLGMEIPEDERWSYGGRTHYSRLIGIVDLHQDRLYKYECPDCKAEFPRETPND